MSRDDGLYYDDDPVDLTEIERSGRPQRKSLLRRFFGVLTVLFSLMFLGLVIASGAVLWVFWTYGKGLPDYHQLATYEPPVATRIHAGNGALLAEHATEKRVFVPVEAMPPLLVQAFLSAEDKAFYSHFGIDLRALVRATATNAMNYGTWPQTDRGLDNHPAGDKEFSADQ
jgi:penicillin-binding protein 1A